MSGPLDYADKPHRFTVHIPLVGNPSEWGDDAYIVHHDGCPTAYLYDMEEPVCFTATLFGGEFGEDLPDSLLLEDEIRPGDYLLTAGQEQTAIDDAAPWVKVLPAQPKETP